GSEAPHNAPELAPVHALFWCDEVLHIARFDFNRDELTHVFEDEVDFRVGDAIITREDARAEGYEVLLREPFAAAAGALSLQGHASRAGATASSASSSVIRSSRVVGCSSIILTVPKACRWNGVSPCSRMARRWVGVAYPTFCSQP